MDEFGTYLTEIEGFPDFRDDPDRVSALVKRMREGDEKAKLSLIESTLKYIVELANAHCRKWGVWQSRQDLVQEANTEVLKNIERYDPTKKSLKDFISFRAHISFIRFWHKSKSVHITDYRRKILNNIERVRRDLTSSLGHPPTLEEISERLGKDESEVDGGPKRPTIVEIDKVSEDDGQGFDVASLTAEESDPLKIIQSVELREILIACLSEEDADLLVAYYESGTDGFRRAHLQQRRGSISAVSARQKKRRLMVRLKDCLKARGQIFDGVNA
jgi:RNA polymerase sigma factor (sigma-70 family)